MEITGPGNVGRPGRIYQQQSRRAPKATAPDTTPSADQVQISEQARRMSMINELRAKLDALPDIRQEKVDEIRAQIEAGTYETPEKIDIAVDRLLGEILGE